MNQQVGEKLLAIASDQSNLPPGEVLGVLNDPRWAEADRVQDWRNYVPHEVRPHWPSLSLDARLVAFSMAWEDAQSEDWYAREC